MATLLSSQFLAKHLEKPVKPPKEEHAQPVKVITWETEVVYAELNSDERQQVNALTVSRLISPDACAMMVSTDQCVSPKEGYILRVADEEHAYTTVYNHLVEHRGQATHNMVGLVIDPEFDKNCPNGVLDHAI